MQPDKPNLPPGWEYSMDMDRYEWSHPEIDDTPDIRISKAYLNWHISYWIRDIRQWNGLHVPLTPEPPLEFAEALYYAAQ